MPSVAVAVSSVRRCCPESFRWRFGTGMLRRLRYGPVACPASCCHKDVPRHCVCRTSVRLSHGRAFSCGSPAKPTTPPRGSALTNKSNSQVNLQLLHSRSATGVGPRDLLQKVYRKSGDSLRCAR